MTFNDVRYVKNIDLFKSDTDDEDDNIMDDRKLNIAYDKALNIVNAEVAKRLAMSTNTEGVEGGSKSNELMPNGKTKSQSTEQPKWKAGMHCRAVYEGDGVEYEAVLERLVSNDEEGIVRFLSYDNIERVPLSSLKPSLGKREQKQQMKEAASELEDGYSRHSHSVDEVEGSYMQPSTANTASTKKKKRSKKNRNRSRNNSFTLSDASFSPDTARFSNMMDSPPPPPPPVGFEGRAGRALYAALVRWYTSGYCAGLQRGMQRTRSPRRSGGAARGGRR